MTFSERCSPVSGSSRVTPAYSKKGHPHFEIVRLFVDFVCSCICPPNFYIPNGGQLKTERLLFLYSQSRMFIHDLVTKLLWR